MSKLSKLALSRRGYSASKISLALGLALSAESLVAPIQAQAANDPTVQTNKGPVQGFIKDGVAQFLGIPYAAPPVGKLRWLPAQPHQRWTQVLDATKYGPICMQTTYQPYSGPANMNEDCLYLNIFTPDLDSHDSGRGRGKLPVIVYIHGGGNIEGESTGYDGSKMALQGHTVVVTMNYRLGLLGDIAVPALDSEGHPFGNYDILDQQTVLRWVKENIKRFGGDPDNVTLGGQSGGCADAEGSVMSHLAKGLFQHAILESHVYEPTPLSSAEAQGGAFATAAGCGSGASPTVAACLRALSAAQIFALDSGPYHSEIIGDGQVLPNASFRTLIQQGQFNHVSIISGTTEDEGTFGLAGTEWAENPRHPFTATDYQNMVNSFASASFPPGTAAQVQAIYPLANYSTPELAMDAIGTDPWSCKQRAINSLLADQVPVYAYEFDDRTAPSYYPVMPGFQILATHTGDIQYLFPLYHGSPLGIAHPLNRQQEELSDEMVAAWTNLAWTGNPNGLGDYPWPRYENRPLAASKTAPAVLSENIPSLSTFTDYAFSQAHHCDFWDSAEPF